MGSSILNLQFLLSPPTIATICTSCVSYPSIILRTPGNYGYFVKRLSCFAVSRKSDFNPNSNPSDNPKGKTGRQTSKEAKNESENLEGSFPGMIPKKPRRGRRSEAAAVEDFVRDRLEQTLESIKEQNPEILENMENFMKENTSLDDDTSDDDDDGDSVGKRMLIEEDDPDWPLDADIGWGIRASEYFDKHSIKNVVGEDGTKIDWEGEIDDGLIKEINCLEWETFAFHPSPLIVLVFERYNRASDNWRVLKELEKAAEVYWKAKDRLPPRVCEITCSTSFLFPLC
ncbi:hypothetical protein ACS0TY_033730 [Phlomoides rotata]